jgi:putative sterol carrier protein
MTDQSASTAGEIFETMIDRFLPEKVGDLNAKIQFELDGAGGGTWHVEVADKKLKVCKGTTPNPTLAIAMPASDFVLMMHGKLNPMTEFMSGKIKVQGDMGVAMSLLGSLKPHGQ